MVDNRGFVVVAKGSGGLLYPDSGKLISIRLLPTEVCR